MAVEVIDKAPFSSWLALFPTPWSVSGSLVLAAMKMCTPQKSALFSTTQSSLLNVWGRERSPPRRAHTVRGRGLRGSAEKLTSRDRAGMEELQIGKSRTLETRVEGNLQNNHLVLVKIAAKQPDYVMDPNCSMRVRVILTSLKLF